MFDFIHYTKWCIMLAIIAHAEAARRPFYIIGHMVNSISQVKHYLDLGANVIESDIQFHPDGRVKEAYHGFPCDCFRTCTRSAKLPDFLNHVRQITDPRGQNNYYNQMVMQFFDLKTSGLRNKTNAGRDLARHVLEYLWKDDGSRKQRLRVLVYINSADDHEIFRGFIKEFESRGQESLLKDVGFDGGNENLGEIQRMFKNLGIKTNIWQGDGKTNCISPLYPDYRLRRAISMRNNNYNIDKVYHWTIDLKLRMRLSLNLGVDGMITNDPDDLVEVLQESYYRNEYRIATPDDDPFEKFVDE